MKNFQLKSLIINPALTLTFVRLISSLTILPFLFLYYLPFNQLYVNLYVALFFCGIALTDFFDGQIARKFNLKTEVGSVLDYLSDKLLLTSSLLCLVWLKKIFVYWAILFLARELLITTLRQILALSNSTIEVNSTGKFKTVLQFIYLFIVIINPHNNTYIYSAILNGMELFFLITSLYITYYSGYIYFCEFYRKVSER